MPVVPKHVGVAIVFRVRSIVTSVFYWVSRIQSGQHHKIIFPASIHRRTNEKEGRKCMGVPDGTLSIGALHLVSQQLTTVAVSQTSPSVLPVFP